MIIRNKTLRIEVKAVADAIDKIQAASKKSGGIITGMQVATDSGSPIYRYEDSGSPSDGTALLGYVVVRVPADKFEAFVTEVSALGTVRYEAETSDDVTQQHVDLSARLDNLRAEEKRLREFFTAAKDVKDMLAIEQELSRVRGEIESLDAQVKYLERQAAMATVTIDLNEPQPIVRPGGENWGFGDAVTTGFRGAASAIQLIIIVAITLAPFAAIALLVFFAIRAIVRKRRKGRAAADDRDAGARNTGRGRDGVACCRPRMRIPLTAAVGIPAAAYVLRAALRGWDFSPDLPADAILGVALVVLVAAAWWLRRSSAADGAERRSVRRGRRRTPRRKRPPVARRGPSRGRLPACRAHPSR